jgi:sulfite reductase (ferredoxin)
MPGHIKTLANKAKPTKVENAKGEGQQLRGSIAQTLAGDQPSFGADDVNLMKFHGVYQQEDRDRRDAIKATGAEHITWFMARVKIPGGALTAQQYLALEKLADQITYNRSLRITTRQGLQFHGVVKADLKEMIRRIIDDAMLSTLAACGDVERNVMAPPAPFADAAHRAVRDLALTLSDHMCPRTNAYHEIWLDGQKVKKASEEVETLYGQDYLPRKFKTGIALPDDNSIDVHSQDVGIVALIESDRLEALNFMVGGGLGMTHNKPATYARLGTPLACVPVEHAVEALQAIAAIFRDHGDRTDRTHARLKYIVEEQGIEAFFKEVDSRVSFKLQPWRDIPPLKHQDWIGEHEQGDGKFFLGLQVPNGRIIDEARTRPKSAIHQIVQDIGCNVIMTPNQNIIFADLSADDLTKLKRTLDAYTVPHGTELSAVRRYAMACPAQPTCGLALSESERISPQVLDQFESELQRLGMEQEPLTIRMTGCPNGCARPYTADIGLVGHKPGHFDIFLGGSIHGHRLADFYALNVPIADCGSALRPLFEAWAKSRQPKESLSDFYQRLFGADSPRTTLTGDRANPKRQEVEQKLADM